MIGGSTIEPQGWKIYLFSAIRCDDDFLLSAVGKGCSEGRKGIFVILAITLIAIIKASHKGNPIGSLKGKDYIKEGFRFANTQPVNMGDKR